MAAANAETLQALQRRPGVTVTLRVDAGVVHPWQGGPGWDRSSYFVTFSRCTPRG